jgi:hypothetical protein
MRVAQMMKHMTGGISKQTTLRKKEHPVDHRGAYWHPQVFCAAMGTIQEERDRFPVLKFAALFGGL